MPDLRKIFVGAAAAILFYQLMLPPVVGLADNGDFVKVTGRFSIHGRVYETGSYIDTTYDINPKWHWVSEFFSSEIPLAGSAIFLNSLVFKHGTFDLRFIGLIHAALFLAACWLFVPLLEGQRRAVKTGICLLILFIYCDVMYVSSMNSFYMDEPTFLFLLLSVVLYFRLLRWHKPLDAVFLFACALLMATSKTQHAPVAILFAALLVATRNALMPGRGKLVIAAAAVIVITTGLLVWKGVPRNYADPPLYNAVFLQIIPHSRDASRTMADLGLDDSYRPLIGKNAFFPDSRIEDPAFRREFEKHITAPKLAFFYALHPRDAYQALIDSLDQAGNQFIFGTFDKSTGFPPNTQSRAFSFWSSFKRRLFFLHGARFIFTLLALTAVFSALVWFRRRSLGLEIALAAIALVLAIYMELFISSLLDSADIARHHFIFFTLFDMMVIGIVAMAVTIGRGLPQMLPHAANTRAQEHSEAIA